MQKSRAIFRPQPQLALTAAAIAIAIANAGCADTDATPPTARERGELLATTELPAFELDALPGYFGDFDLDASHARFGVKPYRLIYRTLDTGGAATEASALVVLPDNEALVLTPLAWMHGTTLAKTEAGSVNELSDDRATAIYFAAAGYAVVAPDYLGLGMGPGPHPYDDLPSEVSAATDALLAARAFLSGRGRQLESGLRVAGFSQGGPAALALGRSLADDPGSAFSIAGLAPIGGPYDMSGSLAKAASGEIAFATAYLSYLTVAWNRVHHLYASPQEAFLPPYDRTIEALFDNTHSPEEVFPELPEALEDLFTPSFLAELRAPSGKLEQVLRAADSVCGWLPEVPVVLYAAHGDQDVPFANAEYCRAAFAERASDVTLREFGAEVDHSTSVTLSLPLVLEQFGALP